MKENTHIDQEITQMLFDLGLQTHSTKNCEIANKLVDYIKQGILSLEQTQSSRHDWSISVEGINHFFSK